MAGFKRYISTLVMALLLVFPAAIAAEAAIALPGTGSAPAVEKTDDTPKDEFGRDNPRSMVRGYLETIAEQDYEKAAKFLNLNSVPQAKREVEGPVIAQKLQNLLDQSGWIRAINLISDVPEGEAKDDLPPHVERIGGIRTFQSNVPILAEHIPAKNGQPAYWVISADTIANISRLTEEAKQSLINQYLPGKLIKNQWDGVPVGHWLAVAVTAIGAYLLVWVVTTSISKLYWKWRNRNRESEETNEEIFYAFLWPLQLLAAIPIVFGVVSYIGVSLLARQALVQFTQIVGWVAAAWIIWGLIDVVTSAMRRSLVRRGQYSVISAVVFMRRALKFALILIVVITSLDSLGFQVTTWLAALGIGGLALALGAQKTVENFVGSLTLIADRPVSIGDTCRFGSVLGKVEDIGMRSTRIRTDSRTVITVPNGDFATMQIENISRRDNHVLKNIIGVRYETTPDQMRFLLLKLRAMFAAHPRVKKNSGKARLIAMNASSLDIDVEAGLVARTADEAGEVREDLFLRIMDVVHDSGTDFAFPSQTLYMARDNAPDAKKVTDAEKTAAGLRAKGKYAFKDLDEKDLEKLHGKIDYPEASSAASQKRGKR